ncbi:GNAT family N-acetyltransferase [Gracilibacillus oryzae]|uniref:GNAT family N-acetyltransferase n=1 Tax=Gracilibacillus oryzae TaxID=1672701 RepID=A0A7C8GU98_9BACI|nr:GNAT family N-acetyltransferase [Gracilibacillus oryzae]KAB8138139.1 GNAT family N-acetyltransferase [Gracilibacillus oryzae]
MKLEFKKVDQDNYKQCAALNVKAEQNNFVAPNWYSLLESQFEDGQRHPLAIYKEGKMIGFLMYVYYQADEDYPVDSWWIERFMIDKKYQNKGLGSASLKEFLLFFKVTYGDVEIRISAEPENDVAIKLYEKIGFGKTGEMVGDETVLLLK